MFNFLKKNKQAITSKQADTNVSRKFLGLKSQVHVDLLAYFEKPRDVKLRIKFKNWEELLDESIDSVLVNFQELNLIEKCNVVDHLMNMYTSKALGDLLHERDLAITGNKEVLVKRLMEYEGAAIKNLISNHEFFVCTEKGKSIIEEYRLHEISRKQTALSLSRAYLTRKEFKQASLTMASYEANCIIKQGINVDWTNYDSGRDVKFLIYIFSKTPKYLEKRGWTDSQEDRINAGMIHLWGSPIRAELETSDDAYLPERMLVNHAHFLYGIELCREVGRKTITVFTCNDDAVCSECKKVSKIEKYRIDKIPEFPLTTCLCEHGCRCWIG